LENDHCILYLDFCALEFDRYSSGTQTSLELPFVHDEILLEGQYAPFVHDEIFLEGQYAIMLAIQHPFRHFFKIQY